MTSLKTLLFVTFAVSCARCGEWWVDAEIGSGYLWRGLTATDDPVIQTSVSYAFAHLEFNVWANAELTDHNDRALELDRIDYTVQYARALKKFTLVAGASAYTFPKDDYPTTFEAFVGVSYDHLLNPALFWYQDLEENRGSYAQVGLFPELGLFANRRSSGLELAVIAGFGSRDFKMGYFEVGHNESGHGMGDHHGDGPRGPAEPDSGLLQVSAGLEYSLLLPKGELTILGYYTELTDDTIHSPRSEDATMIWGLSYQVGF